MEFCDGGDLFDYVANNDGRLNEETARYFFRQVVKGVQHIHQSSIVHRDLSLENIMLTQNGICKIIDFGMALKIPHNGAGHLLHIPRQVACGKKNYMAPEVIQTVHPFQPVFADVWSLGVILFILLTSLPPFESAMPTEPNYVCIVNGHLQSLLKHWEVELSDEAINLMNKILRQNPYDRISIQQILDDPWMNHNDFNPFI